MALLSRFSVLILLTSALAVSCTKTPVPQSADNPPPRTEVALGTVCTINLFEHGTKERYDMIFDRLRQIEEVFSVNLPYSEVSMVNAAAGIRSVQVGSDFMAVAKKALEYAELTDGIFDPTIGPLVSLWGINTPHSAVPPASEIVNVLSLVDWQDFIINEKEMTAFLRRKGMALDFGAIAKGYAADEIAAMLTEDEVPALIDLGGNVYLAGSKKDGSAWNVGVKNPLDREGAAAAITLEGNSTAVTSGTYERFMEKGGTVYHHILNPKKGFPARSGLFSVTVVSTSSIDADALSTALFIMGKENAISFLEKLNSSAKKGDSALSLRHFEAVFIENNHTITATKGLSDSLRILSPDFSR